MRRRYRIAIVAVFLAAASVAVVGLSALGEASEGPLTRALGWLGAATGSVEHRIRDRIGGPPRRETLRWLEPYRTSADRLRKPDVVLLGAYDSGIPRTLDGVLALEAGLHAALPIVQVYTAWGDKSEQRFPVELLTAIEGVGSIPMVTWEPWRISRTLGIPAFHCVTCATGMGWRRSRRATTTSTSMRGLRRPRDSAGRSSCASRTR